jgi:hypothetical protein
VFQICYKKHYETRVFENTFLRNLGSLEPLSGAILIYFTGFWIRTQAEIYPKLTKNGHRKLSCFGIFFFWQLLNTLGEPKQRRNAPSWALFWGPQWNPK